MYNSRDFEVLVGDVSDIRDKDSIEINEIIEKVRTLIELDLSRAEIEKEEIRAAKELFLRKLFSLPSDKIIIALNYFENRLGGQFFDRRIVEFSEAFLSIKEKIPAILNGLNPSLKAKFFRQIIHGNYGKGILLGDSSSNDIAVILNNLDDQLQQKLFTEVNHITKRSFFSELLSLTVKPQLSGEVLNGLNDGLKVMLFTQKDQDEKLFFDRFFDELLNYPDQISEILKVLSDDLKLKIFTKSERNPCEFAAIKIFYKHRSQKHKAALELRPLKEIQQDILNKMAQDNSGASIQEISSRVIDINPIFEAAVAIDMLERIYQQLSGSPQNTTGDLDLLYNILRQSKTAQNHKYAIFLKAIGAIISGKISGEAGNVYILRVPHSDHNAYFVVKCDAENHPIKMSYIDGWGGIFGKNSHNYSFGEVGFDVDTNKISSIEELDRKMLKIFDGKPYPSKEEMNHLLSNFVKCDDENPIIIAKNIPTKIQKRNNCHLKSTLLLMRVISETLDHSMKYLVDGREWSPDLESNGFLEFNHEALSGAGRVLYKDFRNDFIDEQIAVLLKVSTRNFPKFLSFAIENCLENVRDKTMKKVEELRYDLPLLDLPSQAKRDRLFDIYQRRLDITSLSLSNITRSELPRQTISRVGVEAIKSANSESNPPIH